jgi:hypothetical protein
MPKDKALKASAAKDKEMPLVEIGRQHAKKHSLAESKEPNAMPPFTSGLINAGKAIAGGGEAAVDNGNNNNSNNPKAKSLLSTDEDDNAEDKSKQEADAAFEKAKGEAKAAVNAENEEANK